METIQQLWEEKNSTEQKKNLTNNQITVPNDIIKEIKTESVKNVCDDTGNKKRLTVGVKFNRLTITRQFIGKNNLTWVDCICDCGEEITTLLTIVKQGRKKSCKKCQIRGTGGGQFKKKSFGEASFNALFRNYKTNAKYRGIDFNLSKDEVRVLFGMKCFYCGEPPNNNAHTDKRFNGQISYNGIDRKNNSIGYVSDNCVSCCKFCNYAKKNISFEKFIEWSSGAVLATVINLLQMAVFSFIAMFIFNVVVVPELRIAPVSWQLMYAIFICVNLTNIHIGVEFE